MAPSLHSAMESTMVLESICAFILRECSSRATGRAREDGSHSCGAVAPGMVQKFLSGGARHDLGTVSFHSHDLNPQTEDQPRNFETEIAQDAEMREEFYFRNTVSLNVETQQEMSKICCRGSFLNLRSESFKEELDFVYFKQRS